MIEGILFGIIQGVAEWLPVSSEGLIALFAVHVSGDLDVQTVVRFALFLHLGTFLAALVYLRRDVWRLLWALGRYRSASDTRRNELRFLALATVVSGAVGWVLLQAAFGAEHLIEKSAAVATFAIGLLLLVTAVLLLRVRGRSSHRDVSDLTITDGIVAGIAQGCAALPGLSRSGLTVAVLLLRDVRDDQTLRLSFLMSLPAVLGGNIILNSDTLFVSAPALIGLGVAFVVGLATMHGLLRFAKKVNMGWFVLVFGLLMIGAALFV